ncbi:MAG: LysR family transcriptional regulator [Pararhodobacter sp.]
MKPTLRQLECFQAVSEMGNFSRAAERLGMSQPALSQAIRDLEEGLGTRLFDRTTRRVDLTEAGRLFRDTALAGLSEIDRAVGLVQDLASLRRGVVRIAAPPLLASTVLPRLVRAIAAEHPGLDIRLEDLGTDMILDRLRAGRAEIGVGTFPSDAEGMAIMPLLRDRLAAFVPPGHALAGRSALGWADLADQPVVALARESGLRLLTEMGFEAARVAFRPAHEVHQIYTALALVNELGVVAVLPVYAAGAMHGRAFEVLPLHAPAIGREIAMARLRDKEASPAAQAVSQLLIRRIKLHLPELPGLPMAEL